MKALVVGFGSIGARHAKVLTQMGCQVAVVSRHGTDEYRCYSELETPLALETPDYVIVANKTHEHYQTIVELGNLGFSGKVLVEKPLFHEFLDMPVNRFQQLFVGYNLRFHPLIQRLKELLVGQKVITAHAYVGQYLPEWRPKTDYKDTYSSCKAEGGGSLRDLSHELDYLNWMLGGWTKVVGIVGHFSALAGDSEDAAGLLVTLKNCPLAMIHLNYLERSLRREIVINTEEHTYALDFVQGHLCVDNETGERCIIDHDYTYRAQHQAVLSHNVESLCTMEQGRDVVKLICCAEQSMRNQEWVIR